MIMKIILTKNFRGFPLAEFKDRYSRQCSIEISTLADERCVWFGADESRMHLSQDQIEELLPILQHFVETGEIY